MSITINQIRTMATMTVQYATPKLMLSHAPRRVTYCVCDNIFCLSGNAMTRATFYLAIMYFNIRESSRSIKFLVAQNHLLYITWFK